MAATRLQLLASAQVTANGNGAGFPVAGITELLVAVDLTAFVSGSVAIFLQGSDDGGTTWYDLPYVRSLKDNNASQTEGAGAQDGRNIGGSTFTAVGKAVALYKVFSDRIRVKYVVGVSTDLTFGVRAVGK